VSDANIIEINGIEVNLEDAKARKDIENLSLTIGKDGLLYIKKQDGTLIGTGVSVGSSGTDLSKMTMRVNGNTLILLNNGTQIASVDLPSSINSDEVSNLIGKGVSETTYNALGTTDKTIIGGINEVKDNQLILVTDDTSMQGISDSKHDTLETNDKSIIGAINELNTKLRDIPTLFSTEQTDGYYRIKYNNIVIAQIPLGNGSVTPTPTTRYTITNNLSHATNSNSATSIEENASYNATITANSNYRIKNVTVTMYGTDVTDSVYSGGRITIDRVIGNIVITVTTELISGGDEDVSNLDGILKDRLLVWHDEFDDATLDTTKWRYATHNSGGSEQQAYTVGRTENVRLENSNLILEARKDGYVDGWTWSSGRIDTSGLAGFKYGRLEAKLKYDVVSGAFPAFWTIGTCAYYPTGTDIVGVKKSLGTQWAQNGEIDMFEGRGTNAVISQGGWYNQDDGKGNLNMVFGTKNVDASQYHVYAVEWTETSITSYIDGVQTGSGDISNIISWQRPQYIILNMAVGSTGGYPADDCTSMKMEVDWVRVYAPVGVTEKTEVQSISLSQNNVSFNVGDDPIDVYYSVNPSTAWDNNVNYESNNVNVATVYGSRITPVGVGTCKITARATNGVTATINVTVAQNASINSSSIALDKNTLELYKGTNSTLIATATPGNHTDSILWKSSDDTVATVANGVVSGKNTGNCIITAYSSVNSSVKAECSVNVKAATQLSGHPTSGLTLQLDRNGMSSTSWTNAVDNTELQWKVANNNSTDIASYMIFDGDSFYWAGANYKDHLTLSGFSDYYDFGESQTVILAGDFTNAVNPILSNKQKLSQNTSTAYIQGNAVGYVDANGAKLGAININTNEGSYNIDGCIALRYNKQNLRVDCDSMKFTENTVTNRNTTLTSAFNQGSYPALLGNVGTAKIYWKVVLVYNRVLTDEEVQTAMNAIKTFLNS
jgi:beta-glucanase (GH16 family)